MAMHQGQVLAGGFPGSIVQAGTGHSQQGALPRYRQRPELPVHHPPPLDQAHGPDLSDKKSRSTFSCPISWYSRAIRAASLLAF